MGPLYQPDLNSREPQVHAGQFRSLHRTLEYAELVAESEDLKLSCRSSSKERERGREQGPTGRLWNKIGGKLSTPTVSARSEFARTTGIGDPLFFSLVRVPLHRFLSHYIAKGRKARIAGQDSAEGGETNETIS